MSSIITFTYYSKWNHDNSTTQFSSSSSFPHGFFTSYKLTVIQLAEGQTWLVSSWKLGQKLSKRHLSEHQPESVTRLQVTIGIPKSAEDRLSLYLTYMSFWVLPSSQPTVLLHASSSFSDPKPTAFTYQIGVTTENPAWLKLIRLNSAWLNYYDWDLTTTSRFWKINFWVKTWRWKSCLTTF